MRLYILRHGEAEPRAASDAERGLTARGRAEIASIAEQLAARGERVELVLSSPYRRARETAAIVCQRLGLAEARLEACLTPDEPVWPALQLCRLEGECHVLLASHMPFVGRLLLELAPGLGSVGFATGSLAIVDLDVDGRLRAPPQWLQPLAG